MHVTAPRMSTSLRRRSICAVCRRCGLRSRQLGFSTEGWRSPTLRRCPRQTGSFTESCRNQGGQAGTRWAFGIPLLCRGTGPPASRGASPGASTRSRRPIPCTPRLRLECEVHRGGQSRSAVCCYAGSTSVDSTGVANTAFEEVG